MKVDLLKVANVAALVLGQVVPGVRVVEQIAKLVKGLTGREKQDAVVELVKSTLAAAEGLTTTDLADDLDVEHATRAVIDAVVALHNVIARKTGAVA
jgi:hypothetical protein